MRVLSAVACATLLLIGTSSCGSGSTEPKLADGEFRASMQGSFPRALSGEAGFSIVELVGRRIDVEMTDRFPGATADGEQWGVFFDLPAGASPSPNEAFTMTSTDTRVSLLERRRTNGTIDGYEWTVTSGVIRFESVSKGLLTGTFTLDAQRRFGPGSASISGSFRALCPATGALPVPVCE